MKPSIVEQSKMERIIIEHLPYSLSCAVNPSQFEAVPANPAYERLPEHSAT